MTTGRINQVTLKWISHRRSIRTRSSSSTGGVWCIQFNLKVKAKPNLRPAVLKLTPCFSALRFYPGMCFTASQAGCNQTQKQSSHTQCVRFQQTRRLIRDSHTIGFKLNLKTRFTNSLLSSSCAGGRSPQTTINDWLRHCNVINSAILRSTHSSSGMGEVDITTYVNCGFLQRNRGVLWRTWTRRGLGLTRSNKWRTE